MTFTVGSLFDGSGGFPLAAFMCGGVPVWASEVEPYPIAVTKTRFPYMKHLGDISKINGAEIEPVDVITFGSPCQDLSVAGKRAGLDGERSGLFMEAVRIIKEMREATNGKYPRFALWENVPGAFSSNKGEDFRIVLEEIAKISEKDAIMPEVPKGGWAYADCFCGDGWSMAYRVFDAQHWGVPQRRRRIYLVADFAGECAEEILFKREGLSGYFAQGGETWQGVAAYAESSVGAEDSKGKCYGISSYDSNAMKSANPHSGIYEASTSRTLDLNGGNPACNQGGVAIVEPVTFEPGIARRKGGHVYEALAGTLRANAGDNQLAVAYESHPADSRVRLVETAAPTLTAKYAKLGADGILVCAATQQTFIIDSIGGQSEAARETDVAPTLKATHYKFPPVYAAGFCTEHSANARSVGYQDETSPTLRAGTVPATVYDARGNGDGRTVNTITGDHENRITDYSSVLVEPVYCLQGNGIDRADTAGCNGKGWKEEVCYTLNTIDRPAVAMSLQGDEVAGTLKARDYKGVGRQDSLGSAVCLAYGLDRASFNQGKNAKYDFSVLQEQQPTLTARGPGAVCNEYIVRRLTPIECSRLQGFPDNWGDIDPKESFTEEEFHFWHEVRNTHAAINGRQVKDYTEAQMLRWYNKLQTDSAMYKMWGNGIALPTALYVMQGIAEVMCCESRNCASKQDHCCA